MKAALTKDARGWRVLRGGSWNNNDPANLLSSNRNNNTPTNRNDNNGFRCVLGGGVAAVELRKKFGYINRHGEVVIPFSFSCAEQFLNGRAWVEQNGKWGSIDKMGRFIIRPKFDNTVNCSSAKFSAAVLREDKWGFLDWKGKMVIPPKFSGVGYRGFQRGVCKAAMGNRWGLINEDMDFILPPLFEDVDEYGWCEGLCAVQLGGRWGFVNREPRFVIEPRFAHADGFAAVSVEMEDKPVRKIGGQI